jgi:hypothetical protein
MKDVGSAILNGLVENPAMDSEAGCFASTLNMTIRRLYFQSSTLTAGIVRQTAQILA